MNAASFSAQAQAQLHDAMQHFPAALMVQGTTSDAGKSTLACALLRLLMRAGVRAAPFKPQNMALNSAVTTDGGEIGRAQAVQAQAAGLEPHADFNPILLKPCSDKGAQVIVHGRLAATLDARAYHDYKPQVRAAVLASWARLQAQHDCLVVEGAGSPAEINLRDNDIANMGFAQAADIPVILIADIDRGGVFAHLCGTLDLLSAEERKRVKGFVINRFRGDLALLTPGLEWLEARTGVPVLGVLPYWQGLFLDAEDSLALNAPQLASPQAALRIIAPALPRMANHTDCDVWRLHEAVDFRWVGADETPPPADLVILPGSKNVCSDLAWLREQGWESDLARHLRYGGKVFGICGGLQMLGKRIADPHGVEGASGACEGFGWLDLESTLGAEKNLARQRGTLLLDGAAAQIEGYEIHHGHSQGAALSQPLLRFQDGAVEGAISADNQIAATCLHGVFDSVAAQQAVLRWLGAGEDAAAVDLATRREADLDRLADGVAQHIDWPKWQQAFGG